MTLQCEPFDRAAHLAEQRDLFRLSFPERVGHPEESLAYYQWKFDSFPATPRSYEYVANDGGRLVGYYAALPYRYNVLGEERTIGMVCDVMTHPAARGRGVFTALGRYSTDRLADQGLALLTGYPIRPEVIPGHLKVGWKIAFQLPMYIRVLRSDALLKRNGASRLVGIANSTLKMAARLYAMTLPRRRLVVEISSPTLFATNEYATFASAWRFGQRIGLIKDAPFMKWRLGAPGAAYELVVGRDAHGIVALAITRRTTLENVPCLGLLDVMTLPGRERTFLSLVPVIQELALQSGAEAVVSMMSPLWARRYGLRRAAFWKSPARFSLIVKLLAHSNPVEAGSEANWHLMWIDSDDL